MTTPDETDIEWRPRDHPLGAPAAPVLDQTPDGGVPALARIVAPAAAPPSGRSRRLPWILAAGGAVVVLALGMLVGWQAFGSARSGAPAAPSASPSAQAITARGVFTLADSDGVENLDDVHCTGMRGYDDIGAGAQVVITDQAGTVIGTGSLSGGTMLGSGPTRQCQFPFEVTNVPAGKSFYGVSISHRGTLQYTENQLTSGLELQLGG